MVEERGWDAIELTWGLVAPRRQERLHQLHPTPTRSETTSSSRSPRLNLDN